MNRPPRDGRRVGRKRSLALGLMLVALTVPAHADTEVPDGRLPVVDQCDLPGIDDRCERWTATHDGSDLMGMAVSPEGDRVFTGGGRDGILAHDVSTGELLWQTKLQGSGRSGVPEAFLYGLAVSPDGKRVFAFGDDVAEDALPDATGLRYNSDLVVAAYDAATGTELWRTWLGLPGLEGTDRYESVESAGASDLLSVNSIIGTGHARDDGIAVSSDGRRVYVTGTTYLRDRIRKAPITKHDVLAAGFDASTGRREWLSTTGSRFGVEFGRFARVSPDGRKLYVGGETSQCTSIICPRGDFYIASFRAYAPNAPGSEGKLLWTAGYSGQGGEEHLEAMEVAPDGDLLYLTGSSEGEGSEKDKDWVTMALRTSNGSEAWVSRYEGPTTAVQDAVPVRDLSHTATSLAVAPDGDRVFVTGGTMVAGINPPNGSITPHIPVYGTVAYDAGNGEQIWEKQYGRYPGGLPPSTAIGAIWTDKGRAVDVSPDGGTVYVVGTSNGGPNFQGRHEQATIAYDAATGDERWIARLEAPEYYAWVEAAADGSSVIVASVDDWAIRAYDGEGSA